MQSTNSSRVSRYLFHQSPEDGIHRFSRGSLLPLKDDYLWRVEAGVVRTLTWFEDGTVIALGIWGRGDVLGKPLTQANPFQAECLTPIEATLWPIDQWESLTDSLLAYALQTEKLTLIRSYKRSEEMLLRLLDWLATKFGHAVDNGHELNFHLTHQILSELLGLTRVTVTRLLGSLEDQGLIRRLSRQKLIVQEEEHWHYEI